MVCSNFMQIVVAAVIERDGLILIGQRKPGKWHEFKWEFPGGKIEPGETPRAAIARELKEELGVTAEIGQCVAAYEYQYPGRSHIRLIFFAVTNFTGEMQGGEYHDMRWEKRERLPDYDFLEGDVDFVRSLAASNSVV